MSLVFYVPPGIGDFSAMYAKLCNIDRPMAIRASMDQPMRISPFLDLLPKIQNGGYANHGALASVQNTLPPGTDLRSLPDGDYFLSVNHWLEEGNRLENWVPGPTSYHYNFAIPSEDGIHAKLRLDSVQEFPLIGVYTSAYGNSRHWGFWDWQGWRDFLAEVSECVPKETWFVFIGAEYDLAISEVVHKWMQEYSFNSLYLVGETEIGATIEIIRRLDYLFTFPSGIGFLADVVNTPHTMWFPKLLDAMRYSFPDPVNMDIGRTVHNLFTNPEDAAYEFREGSGLKQFLHRIERRKYAQNRNK